MPERSFLSDILQRVAVGARLSRGKTAVDIGTLCDELLSDKGEASGLATAMQILDTFESLENDKQAAFFMDIANRFGVDETALQSAISGWKAGDDYAARKLHYAAEPKSQELIRRLNRVPGATARLVTMRSVLLEHLKTHPELSGIDTDFRHLFSSWFSRGFLEIRRINWSTPAEILEKIITYEAVHEITGWDDLRQRVAAPDRKLFAFFHPAIPTEPLIFVEVALTTNVSSAVGSILARDRTPINPASATTAVFYSISNCQSGLRGISFGNFLIKQVVSELAAELPALKTFVTLSPTPELRKWAESLAGAELTDLMRESIANAKADTPPTMIAEITARYLLLAKRASGTVYDPVAHFHLGNGAILHRVNVNADLSPQGIKNAWGVMVNYLYDGKKIEANHQAYATEHQVAASPEVRVMAGLPKKLMGDKNV
ncbi:MAG: malonyl-CoA decarboxylase [Proteobacteria bacterium]|nr:malonyl-CoA decarboxylase [Pseudomonadota bacterium]MDA1285782.1 malonyl-CoA decarboxylase [Pseudomonadota bacterium]